MTAGDKAPVAEDGSVPRRGPRLRHRIVGVLGALFLGGLRLSLRARFHGEERIRAMEEAGTPFILAFWHCHLLMMRWGFRGRRIAVLMSRSRDGEFMAQTMRWLDIGSVRGSTSRGGSAGLRALVRKAREGWCLGFTPDGPRGPAGSVQPGVLAAAATSGLPIIPVAWAVKRRRLLASWDRMIVPAPFGVIHYVYGEPYNVERGYDAEATSADLQSRLNAVGQEAERRALSRRGGGERAS